MSKNALVLLVQENSAGGEYIRQALESAEDRFRVQPVAHVATALARIAGGGVDLVILDLSGAKQLETEKLDSFLHLRGKAPEMPIVVVCDSDDNSLVMRAVEAGAAKHVPRARCDTELASVVRSAIGRRPVQLKPRPHLVPERRKAGALTAFMGAKGGVGTTTVALNVACALAQWGRIILTELRPMFGALPLFFRPHRPAGNIAHLLQNDAGTIAAGDIEACLWHDRNIPGLEILFGPQTIEQCREVAALPASAVVKALPMLADYVVADLPPSLSGANRAVIEECDTLLLVVERDPLCIESAKPILETIHAWNAVPPFIGSVVVNRVPLAAPMDLAEIEKQLAIPTLAVIPPASDLCLAARKAGKPLTEFDAESLAAHSITGLAEALLGPGRKPARAS